MADDVTVVVVVVAVAAAFKVTESVPALLLIATTQLVLPEVQVPGEAVQAVSPSVQVPTVDPPLGVAVNLITELFSEKEIDPQVPALLPLERVQLNWLVCVGEEVLVIVPVPVPVSDKVILLASLNAVCAVNPEF